jgi:hypothetical protein
VLCLLLLTAARPVSAAVPGFHLRLSPRGLIAGQEPALAAFVRSVEPLVPPAAQARIAQAVQVSFDLRPQAALPPKYEEPEVVAPDCPRLDPSAGAPAMARARSQELAQLEPSAHREEPSRIRLHSGFRKIIASGPQAAQRYPCGHRTLYQLAVAALLHEVMHLYDAQVGLSRDPRYRHLQRFDRQGLFQRMAPRNLLTVRSPDPYEATSLAESLAVNAEFFLLDPEYRCRRPASYAFFEAALHYRPFPQARCEPNWTVYPRGEPRSVDPQRIYQVHYLMAARGQGLASRFGHSMFRLVICGAARARVGPECLQDVQDHLVLGFGANLQTDLQISAWKGLTGGYVSQLFVKTLPDVLIEYTERGQRGLESFPLRLARPELEQLVRRAVEIYWSYEGRYYFLTNNCASESLSLLKSASADPALHGISRITPSGLRDDLQRLGLIETLALPAGEPGRLAKERMGLYFPSLHSRHEAWYSGLRAHLPREAPPTLRRYLLDSRAQQRQGWLQAILRLPPAQRLPLSAQAFALEGLIMGERFAEMERLLSRAVIAQLDSAQPLLSSLRLLLPRLGIELPWQQTSGGYGVPFASELRRPPDQERDAVQQQLWREALRILQVTHPLKLAEWQATQEHRRQLAEQLLADSAAPRGAEPATQGRGPRWGANSTQLAGAASGQAGGVR